MNHYSLGNRANALKSIGSFLSECREPTQYIAIIVPNILELVLDKELKVRESLATLLKNIWIQFPFRAFSAVQKITITYINSGLTSLERGIRKTTAIMLLDLVSVHPTFIEIQFNQIITQMLTLLSEPLHVSGLSKQLDTDEYKDTGGGKQLAKKGGRQGNSNNSSGDSNSINTSSKQALMPIIIAILAAVLQDHNFSSSINSSSKPLCSLEYEESSIYNSTIIVRKKKRSFPVALLSLSAESAFR